jgi:autotransporter passenger strand-loop-strand repeat protein
VAGGATAIGDLLFSGGREVVQSGGLVAGTTLYGGTLEVQSGGVVGAVRFGADGGIGGTLMLDASASFHGVLAGFGDYGQPDQIDLVDIGFGTTKKSQTKVSFTEAASTLSGTLTVSDGLHAANVQLVGDYIPSNFVAASDGNGGTLITFTSATVVTGGNGHGHA